MQRGGRIKLSGDTVTQVAALERLWQYIQDIDKRLQAQITILDSKTDEQDRMLADLRSRYEVLIDAVRAHQSNQQSEKHVIDVLDKEMKVVMRMTQQNQWELTNPDSGIKSRVAHLEEIATMLNTERAERRQQSDRLSKDIRNLMIALITAGCLWVASQLPALIQWIAGVL